ncbi:MAG: FAD-binding protein [Geminicoccaceae bacterium]
MARGALIARGNGRAYGDSAFNETNTVDMRCFNRMLEFDPETGQLVVEAGVILGDVISAFLPRGWFPPVTPGTKFVTIGGMIAADVHGKNHHQCGSFGAFVDWIDVMTADGEVLRCSRETNSDLFLWTIGGMGLSGIILRASFRLRPVETGWIRQTLIPMPDLASVMAAFEACHEAPYSVAWIDCSGRAAALGRSVLILGDHAKCADLDIEKHDRPFETPLRRTLSLSFDAPSFLLNSWTARAFNELYYRKALRMAGESLVDWDVFFYPLDAVLGWNRIYGRKGFMQFQCVLPLDRAQVGIEALIAEIGDTGQGAFLAVLKRFGRQESRFSFPMEGYSLALDFPVNATTLALLNRLDRITLEQGGRFYLAKDSRMSAKTLCRADPRVETFRKMREENGRAASFQSSQSKRLAL